MLGGRTVEQRGWQPMDVAVLAHRTGIEMPGYVDEVPRGDWVGWVVPR
jgi:hypothetical protein